MNILEEIAARTRERVAKNQRSITREEMRRRAEERSTDTGFPFEQTILEGDLSFICEVKKASPSKGLIAADFPYTQIAKEYEDGGASAISVLTEPLYFRGKNEYLTEIREQVTIPVLRKDFTVDEYMIYEAKAIGADAILLICAILEDEQLLEYRQIADSLGLSALVEAHDQNEVERAMKAGARLVGVNNRDLKTFTVDLKNSIRYRQIVPPEIGFVSESGIRNAEDIAELAAHQVNGVLIGETLMRAGDRTEALRELRSGAGKARRNEERNAEKNKDKNLWT